MQYPQIQFYRGSLVRLPSGRLKQVEELSSDDFLDNALLFGAQQDQQQQQQHRPHLTNQHCLKSLNNNNSNSSYGSSNNSLQQAAAFCRNSSSPSAMEKEDFYNEQEVGEEEEDADDGDDEELDVVTADDRKPAELHHFRGTNSSALTKPKRQQQQNPEELCIGLSVVKDFLEVSLIASSVLPASSIGSNPVAGFNQSVLIKFALGVDSGNQNIVFNEVPIDQPFFVFQRGWSSWNPQRTYDKFGLKCRKLKIGDTCISLFRKLV